MNRRAFLGSLSALSAGMLLDTERALWVPGRTTYFDIVRPEPMETWFAIEYDDGTIIRWAEPGPRMRRLCAGSVTDWYV